MALFSIRCRARDAASVAEMLRQQKEQVEALYAERMQGGGSSTSRTLEIGTIVPRSRSVLIEVNSDCAINVASLSVHAVVSPSYPVTVPLWG